MSKNPRISIDPALLSFIAPGMAPRKARRVVTRSGTRSRGNFPSLKASAVRYESQLELAAWRVLEAADSVESFGSHPVQLRIEVDPDGAAFRYTPDWSMVMPWREAVVGEVKPDVKFMKPDVCDRLRKVWSAFERDGTQFVVLLESDLCAAPGLREELEILFRSRPWKRNWVACEKASMDEPTNSMDRPFDDAAWVRAAHTCDELLARVMARDFDQTLDQARSWIDV